MKPKTLLALMLSCCVLLPAMAQTRPGVPTQTTADQDDVVKITTNLVQIDAVVTKGGKPVPNLTADDFEIYEDGRRQMITSFAYISNVPSTSTQPEPAKANREKTANTAPSAPVKRDAPRRTVAFVVDDLGLSAESMGQVRRQLRKFIAEQLQPNDLVAIIRTGGELGALQQFTNDKRLLSRAVEQLKWNIRSRVGIGLFAPARRELFPDVEYPRAFQSYSGTLKALRFILDAMGELPGRKSMVLLSDSLPADGQEVIFTERTFPGPEEESTTSSGSTNYISYSGLLQKVAEKAIRASVVIYSVDTQGLATTGITAADSFSSSRRLDEQINSLLVTRSALLHSRRQGGMLMAKETGGFQVRNSNDFNLKGIMEDQSGYYLLGYRPTEETFNRRFHQIRAKVKRSGMTVRTRSGFFGVTEEEANRDRPSHLNSTNLALLSPFGAQDVEVDLTSFFANDPSMGSVVRSFVYFDAKNLTLDEVDGRRHGAIELYGVIFGDNGVVVEQGSRGVKLNWTESDYQKAITNGVHLRFDLPVKRPGYYQVRVAVRDRTSLRLGSAGQFVDVPNLKNKRLAVSGIVLGTVGDFSGAASDLNRTIVNPGARRFEQNSNVYFAYMIYNARRDSAGPHPNLVMQANFFHDGKSVYSGPEVPVEFANQPDPTRVFAHGVVPLKALISGSYYLQVVITDKTPKSKEAPVVQWVDFEIAK
jgi:VWFA-related protein